MPKYLVTASNMAATYSAGEYDAEDEYDAMDQARRNPRNFLFGLSLRARLVK